MKIKFTLTVTFALACLANAHNFNEFTSNVSNKRYGWFGKRTRIANAKKQQHITKKEDDLIHRHDMHSFTGTEGIDHHCDKGAADDEVKKPKSHNKKLLQMSDNLLKRHAMHSYTSLEGMDHFAATKSTDQHDDDNAPTLRNSRRRKIDHFRNPHVTAKPVKQVQEKRAEEYQGESLPRTIYFNH